MPNSPPTMKSQRRSVSSAPKSVLVHTLQTKKDSSVTCELLLSIPDVSLYAVHNGESRLMHKAALLEVHRAAGEHFLHIDQYSFFDKADKARNPLIMDLNKASFIEFKAFRGYSMYFPQRDPVQKGVVFILVLPLGTPPRSRKGLENSFELLCTTKRTEAAPSGLASRMLNAATGASEAIMGIAESAGDMMHARKSKLQLENPRDLQMPVTAKVTGLSKDGTKGVVKVGNKVIDKGVDVVAQGLRVATPPKGQPLAEPKSPGVLKNVFHSGAEIWMGIDSAIDIFLNNSKDAATDVTKKNLGDDAGNTVRNVASTGMNVLKIRKFGPKNLAKRIGVRSGARVAADVVRAKSKP